MEEAADLLLMLKKLEDNGIDILSMLTKRFSIVEHILGSMPVFMDADFSDELDAVISLRITDSKEKCYSYRIDRGFWQVIDNPVDETQVSIEAPSSVWMAVASGKVTPESAVESGSMRISTPLL